MPERRQIVSRLTPKISDLLFRELVDMRLERNANPAYRQAHWDQEKFPDYELCYVKEVDDRRDMEGWAYWYYACKRTEQDNYNWEYSDAGLSGVKFPTVTRTYINLRDEFTQGTPAQGATMPDVPAGRFSGTFVLVDREQKRIGDRELDSIFVVEQHVYGRLCSNRIIGIDDVTGKALGSVTTLHYGGESITHSGVTKTVANWFADSSLSYWGKQSDGKVRHGQQISCNWYAIVLDDIVPYVTPTQITGSNASTKGILLRSYNTEENYFWPMVLRADGANAAFSANNDVVLMDITYKRQDGGGEYVQTVPRYSFSNPTFNGPTKMLVEEWWVSTPLAKNTNPPSNGGLPEAEVMIPREINYNGAQFDQRIEPSLHDTYTITDDVNDANHPTIKDADYSQQYPATTPFETWPESLIADVKQEPYPKGGYRVRVVTAYRPEHYVAPTS